MTDNLDIWRKLEKTDPAHTKGFKRAGGFSGTAVKPIYSVQKMTEVFGPAGQGWGTTEPDFQVVNGVNNEVMVYCTVGLWWGKPPGGRVWRHSLWRRRRQDRLPHQGKQAVQPA